MISNDNKNPMSPLGKMIFDAQIGLNRMLYCTQQLRDLQRPKVVDKIVRISAVKS